MTEFTIHVVEGYEPPPGMLTQEQYVNFVMNRAAQSYQNHYKTQDLISGIQAACDEYNAALPDDQNEGKSP